MVFGGLLMTNCMGGHLFLIVRSIICKRRETERSLAGRDATARVGFHSPLEILLYLIFSC
jgi:hypothetical protein